MQGRERGGISGGDNAGVDIVRPRRRCRYQNVGIAATNGHIWGQNGHISSQIAPGLYPARLLCSFVYSCAVSSGFVVPVLFNHEITRKTRTDHKVRSRIELVWSIDHGLASFACLCSHSSLVTRHYFTRLVRRRRKSIRTNWVRLFGFAK